MTRQRTEKEMSLIFSQLLVISVLQTISWKRKSYNIHQKSMWRLFISSIISLYMNVNIILQCEHQSSMWASFTNVSLIHQCEPHSPMWASFTNVSLIHQCEHHSTINHQWSIFCQCEYYLITNVNIIHSCENYSLMWALFTNVRIIHKCLQNSLMWASFTDAKNNTLKKICLLLFPVKYSSVQPKRQ